MKGLIISLLLFSAALLVLGQKGYKVIRKAKRNYEHGRSDRALKLLAKAETMNYGWCGNAWMLANKEIQLLRMKIYMLRNPPGTSPSRKTVSPILKQHTNR